MQLLGHINRRHKQEHEYLNRQFSLWYLNIRYETLWILFGTILVHIGDGHLNDSPSMIAD